MSVGMVIEARNAPDMCLDLEQAAAVMRESWRENKEQSLRYTPEFLQSCVEYPGRLPAIVPSFHENGELAAFVFGFPRTVRLAGRELNLLLMTFFTVAPKFKGQGLGSRVWAESIRRARASGYDGALYYCVEGNRSNAVTAAGCRAAGCEPRRIFSVSYLMRLLRTVPDASSQNQAGLDLAWFERAAAEISARVPLCRQWSLSEARWQCVERVNAISATFGCASGTGALTGYTMQVEDEAGTTCTFLEDVFWDDLSTQAKGELVKAFVTRCSQSAQVMIVPLLGYFDAEPFRAAGFRRSTRLLNAYLALWNDTEISALPAMYMDVI